MKIHKKSIEHYEDKPKLLAESIGDLRYDALSRFLENLSNKLSEDGLADERRGRKKLAETLFSASNSIMEAKFEIDESWRISKPFMEDYEG